MTFLLFFITLSLLILVHEWGHFYAARRLGIKVEEFGFGFPPKLVSTVKNGTRYVLNLLPIGGYVKIYGEQGEGADEHQSFASRPVWQRLVIVGAGVFMNIMLAWVFYTFAHGVGITKVVEEKSDTTLVTIVAVEKNSPAEQAGVAFGDVVEKFSVKSGPASDEKIQSSSALPSETRRTEFKIGTIGDFQQAIKSAAGAEVVLTLARNGTTREITAVPRASPPPGSGALGIALEYIAVEKTSWYKAPFAGLESTYRALTNTVTGLAEMIKLLILERKVPADISGPVGIFRLAGSIQDLGLSYILQFIAIISINLAILNALPIPALDGGRILFMIIEKIRRKAISKNTENISHAVGFGLLILLMALVTFRDIRNLF